MPGWIHTISRRDRWQLLVAVVLVCALGWTWLLVGAGMDMNPLDLTVMAGMDGWLMRPAEMSPAYALLFFSMWWVMMVAMMLPGAAPTLLLFARIKRKAKSADAPRLPTVLVAAGYLLVWGGFSALATALQWGLEGARALSPMLSLSPTQRWVAVAILVDAGLWQ
jgi:predicted metal-binding membrane protein